MLHLYILAPLAAALIMVLASGRDGRAALRLSLTASLFLAALGICAVTADHAAVNLAWFTLPGTSATVHYALELDGINSWMVFLVFILGPVSLLGAVRETGDRLREFAAAIFALQSFMVGAFLAADLAVFYVFFEAMLLPMLVILGLFGEERERKSATKQFFIYTMAGSAMMLVAIWYLAAVVQTTSFDALPAAIAGMDAEARSWCFWAFVLAFMVKTPLMPFHSWQAPVYAICPAGGAVLLAGAMAKLGTYGFLRLVMPFFPGEAAANAGLLITLALIGVIGGAVIALTQKDLKKLLAFSSLSHLGLVVIGIVSGHAAGMSGAVVQMVAHGLSVGALFLCVGALEHRFGGRGIDDFGGLAGRMPILAVLFVGAALAAVALPGTAGFIGEFLLLVGTFKGLSATLGTFAGVTLTLIAGLSLILGACYVLRCVQRVLYGPERELGQVQDLKASEALAVAPLLALSLLFGFYPTGITRSADATIAEWYPPQTAVSDTMAPAKVAPAAGAFGRTTPAADAAEGK